MIYPFVNINLKNKTIRAFFYENVYMVSFEKKMVAISNLYDFIQGEKKNPIPYKYTKVLGFNFVWCRDGNDCCNKCYNCYHYQLNGDVNGNYLGSGKCGKFQLPRDPLDLPANGECFTNDLVRLVNDN